MTRCVVVTAYDPVDRAQSSLEARPSPLLSEGDVS
jgi:hypothetical protein